jgi:acyl-ACP thioesterase
MSIPAEDVQATVTYRIRSYECEENGNASLQNICNFVQDTAWVGARKVKVDMQNPEDGDKSWVLLALKVEMYKYPKWRDEIHITTWPAALRKLYCHRDFIIRDNEGEVIGRATSQWILFDLGKRRPLRPPQELKGLIPDIERGLDYNFTDKFPEFTQADAENFFRVRQSDVDVNKHVNNVNYIEWAAEIGKEEKPNYEIHSIEMRFLSESVYGDTVTTELQHLSDTQTLHQVLRLSDGKVLSTAVFNWKPLPSA